MPSGRRGENRRDRKAVKGSQSQPCAALDRWMGLGERRRGGVTDRHSELQRQIQTSWNLSAVDRARGQALFAYRFAELMRWKRSPFYPPAPRGAETVSVLRRVIGLQIRAREMPAVESSSGAVHSIRSAAGQPQGASINAVTAPHRGWRGGSARARQLSDCAGWRERNQCAIRLSSHFTAW